MAGHLIDPVTPRRWLLVDLELAIPDAPEANGCWTLDHLFLDQDGVPTPVEVKRGSDTRIRREDSRSPGYRRRSPVVTMT